MIYQFTESVYIFQNAIPAGTLIPDTELVVEFEEGHTISLTKVTDKYVCNETEKEYNIGDTTIQTWLKKGYIQEI